MRDDAPTPVFRDIIDHPSAWTNASLGGKEGITYRLTEQQLVAFEEVGAAAGVPYVHDHLPGARVL